MWFQHNYIHVDTGFHHSTIKIRTNSFGKDRADYTAILVGGLDSNGQLHIVNCIRDRLSGDEIVDTLLSLQKVYNPLAVGGRKVHIIRFR
jgi:hypothetical protein